MKTLNKNLNKSGINKKLFKVIIALFFISVANVNAQMQLGANVGPSLPVGNFRDGVQMGGGFDAFIQYRWPKSGAALGIKSGFNFLPARSYSQGISPVRYNLVPLLATFKYPFESTVLIPFIGMDAGGYYFRMRRSIGNFNLNNSFWNYCLAPVFGVDYNLSDNLALSVNARYNILIPTENTTRTMMFVNVNVGIIYTFHKQE